MRFITLLATALLLAGASFAQNGKIAGKISDKTYGEPVIGAAVGIQGMSIGAVTDVDGNFMISVPSGEYVVEIKYIGYQQKNIEGVAVKAGQTTEVKAILEESKSTQMSEVVITARMERETVNALYIQQRNSVSLSSGISADIIQRSPDKNTGEVLKRVSGASMQDGKYVVIRGLNDRYNMAMVNNAIMPSTEPDRKAFSFDVIPSDIIDNIIINKTATPDMPGDFAGGVVKVLTKDVPEKNFLNVGIGLGYNTQTTFKDFTTTPDGGAAYVGFPSGNHQLSSSFGTDRRAYLSKTLDERNAAVKELPENSYDATTRSALPNTSIKVSGGRSETFKNGSKLGVVGGLSLANSMTTIADYKRGKFLANEEGVHTRSSETQHRSEANSAGMLNLAYTKGKSRISLKNLYNKIYDKVYIDRDGYSTGSFQQNPFYITKPMERSVMSNQLEGSHAVGARNIKIDWNLNYSNLRANMNDFRTLEYMRNIGTNTGFFEDPTYETSPAKLVDRNTRRFFSNLADDNIGANLDVTYPFEIQGRKQTLKAGYLGLMKSREFSARTFQYKFNSVTAANDENLRTMSPATVLGHNNLGVDKLELDEITFPSDAYQASGNLHSAYVMLDNNIGEKLRIIWGARYEAYTQNLKATDRAGNTIDQTTPFNNLLPSASITYDINEKQKLRLAGSQTVNRPEFREIAPFTFIDYENVWSVSGNPSLVRADITNVDLRYEIYPNGGEAITIGAFYKHFKNPIESKLDDQSNLDYLIYTYQNAASAYAAGVEFEARKRLSFISSALDNFIIGTNLTYIYSRVDASNIVGASAGNSAERPLQGQSPYIANVSLMYNSKKGGWSASALYNRIGQRIAFVGSRDILSTWENGRNIVDLQLGKQVLKGKGEFKLTVSDLLNSPHILYWNTNGSNAYKKGSDLRGVDNDLAIQHYRTGTGVSVGFTYRIGE